MEVAMPKWYIEAQRIQNMKVEKTGDPFHIILYCLRTSVVKK